MVSPLGIDKAIFPQGYLVFFNYPGQGRIGTSSRVFGACYLTLAVLLSEFGTYKTRITLDEATVVDYWM